MEYILSQILGTIGYSLLAYSFFKKEKKQILYVQILAYIGFTTHYILLGALTGTVCNILGFIALILIYLIGDNKERKKVLVSLLIPLLILMYIVSYENIYSLFPVAACLITFISFLSKEENIIRFIGIISGVLWLVYGIIYVSYSAIVFELVVVIASTVAYIKNRKNTNN